MLLNRARALAVTFALTVLLTPVSASPIDWPMEPRTQAQPIGNSYGEYQNYGGAPYLHPGIDILQPPGTPVFAVKSGYVKAVLTTSASLHWRVAIGDSAGTAECDGWLYAHLDQFTIQVLVGEFVSEGDYLGDLVTWPVANFHHLHFVKIRNSGTTWPSNWDFIVNPLDELSDVTDLTAPVFQTVNGGVKFAFFPDNTHSYFGPGDTLSSAVDIIAHLSDKVGHLTWRLAPYMLTFEIRNDTFSTGAITSVVYTGQLFWEDNVTVTYQDDATYNTLGDYDGREYYFIVTNTDGDSVVELSDRDGAWQTAQFNNGGWWVKVTAYDRGGNVTADSQLVTTRNFFVASGTVDPCDGDPDSSGTQITAPDMPGAPSVMSGSDGSFALPNALLGQLHLRYERPGYSPKDTSVTVPGGPYDVVLTPSYLVGDLDFDGDGDAIDLAHLIDIIFFGSINWPDPYWAGDLDFNRQFDAVDLALIIDYIFFDGSPGSPRCYP